MRLKKKIIKKGYEMVNLSSLKTGKKIFLKTAY